MSLTTNFINTAMICSAWVKQMSENFGDEEDEYGLDDFDQEDQYEEESDT
jgi:hypothetical protein